MLVPKGVRYRGAPLYLTVECLPDFRNPLFVACISLETKPSYVCCIPHHCSTFPKCSGSPFPRPSPSPVLIAYIPDCKLDQKTDCLQHAILQVNETQSREEGAGMSSRLLSGHKSIGRIPFLLCSFFHNTMSQLKLFSTPSLTSNLFYGVFLHADSSLGYPATLNVCESLTISVKLPWRPYNNL